MRDANKEDISGVIAVHIKAFDGFFLSKLGPIFLKELYNSFAFRSGGVLRVLCDDNGQVLGFAAGATHPEAFFRKLKKERAVYFLLCAIPGFFRNPLLVLKKLWYAFFYKGEAPSKLSEGALLSSIAVDPDVSGKSLGKQLLSDFERVVYENGANSLYLTTDKHGNDNVVGFYLKNGYETESEFVQADGRKMLRFIKSLHAVSE